MDFDGSVPLPVGTEHSQNTVSANPILQIQGEDIEVHSETDSGWPTIITMSLEDYDIGTAVDYLGTWHGGEVGMEEVDLILYYHDGEWMWRAIVAFSTKSDAIERGQYEIDGYEGYELVPWKTEDRFERMEELVEENVTPIAYTEEHPTYPAHATQAADNIHALNRMFGIGQLGTLTERRDQIRRKVIPRKVRWENEDTSLQDLARQIVGDDEDVSKSADEPYGLGDKVKVDLNSEKPDSQYQGTVGIVTEVAQDDLGEEVEREVKKFRYKIESGGEEIRSWFRHRHLVPSE